jgi:hypothetical protein
MTDTITLPRATVQQALERLMLHHRTWDARDDLNAITALRAALEQPEQPVQEPLKPNATTRLQDPGAYDRGVLAGLRQALAICSDLENFAADRLAWDIQDAIDALRAALEQPDRAQKMRDAGYTRRPTLREMAEPELVNFPEEKLQAVAEYFGDKYHVWYGIGARDVEEVLCQSVRRGLVTLNFDTGEQPEQAEPVEIKPPNPEGATQCIVRWFAETPAGWVGAWDREALEQFTHPPRRETEPAFDALVAISLLTHLGGEVAEYADVVEAVRRLHALNGELLAALKLAVRQNDHDMLMTGEELRDARAAIARAEAQE